jgi:multiple sugar transport system substrate-binding protein/sn-glycerol 3-phosphate transport system substrate-binding protein
MAKKAALFMLLSALAASAAGAQAFDTLVLRGTQVTYWYQHSQIREAALQKMIARFNATNPWGIAVRGEYAGNYSEIANKMTAAIAGGRTPDLVVAYQNNAATYELADALVDLGPYVEDKSFGYSPKDLADFFPGFLVQDIHGEFGGKRLGWPPNRSAEVLYYNVDWLKALGFAGPPKTWAEFYEMAKKATDPAKGTVGYEINFDASSVFGQVVSRGGDFRPASGSGYALDTPQLRDAFAFMVRMYKEGYAKKVGESFGDQTDFVNQKVLFNVTSTAGIPFFEAGVKKGAKGPFAWSVASLPHSTPKPVLDVYGASVSVVKSTPEKQLASWLFLRWMSEPEQQAEWTRVSNYFPVRKSTAERLGDYLAANPRFAAAWEALKASDQKSEPSFTGYDEVRDAISAAYNAVLDGADVAATVADLNGKANRIFQKYKP